MGDIYTVPLGRAWKWEVKSGENWLEFNNLIGGSLSGSPEYADVRTKRDGVYSNSKLATVKNSGEIRCRYEDVSGNSGTTWTRDPAQAAVEAFMEEVNSGVDGGLTLRLTRPTDGHWKTMNVTGSVDGVGGDNNEGTPWTFKFEVQGAPSAWTAS